MVKAFSLKYYKDLSQKKIDGSIIGLYYQFLKTHFTVSVSWIKTRTRIIYQVMWGQNEKCD